MFNDSVEVVEADVVDPRELIAIQWEYDEWKKSGKTVPKQVLFDYSWSLVRTKDKRTVARGVKILTDLYHRGSEAEKREYVYYLAVGNAKLHNLVTALRFCDAILTVEPNNHQVVALRRFVKRGIIRDGLVGMTIFFVGAVSLGLGLRKIWSRWRR